MLRDGIRLTMAWLRRAVTQPFQELNRWQRAARFVYDLGRYGARQLREDRAPQMAAALAFRTLFGLAPVLVVGTILVKATKGSEAILRSLHELLAAAGLDKIRVVSGSESAGAPGEASVTLAEWLENLTSQLVNMNLSGIGWVGLAVIIYAAIGLMVTIENSFNIVYRAPGGRPWTRRVPLYWFILTVGPVLMGLASYVNNQFTGWIASVQAWHSLLLAAQTLWSFGVAWLFMFAAYTLIPNATVALRPALAGTLVATVLLGIGKHSLGAYLGSAFSINQLYGSLGLVPLFMFWVYLMWLAVLFGLQFGATLQMLHGRSLDEMDPPRSRTGMVDPTSVLTVVEVIAEHFAAGQPVTSRQVADITSIAEPMIARIVERLVHEGWLHRVERPDRAVILAKPPDQMNASDFIEIGFRMVDEGGQGRCSALAKQLRAAQQTVAEGETLATLVSV
jgi:membrane protein